MSSTSTMPNFVVGDEADVNLVKATEECAEHLVAALWYDLKSVPWVMEHLKPDVFRAALPGPCAMVYSEMVRLQISGQLNPGQLKNSLIKQAVDMEWLSRVQNDVDIYTSQEMHDFSMEVINLHQVNVLRGILSEGSKSLAQTDADAPEVAGVVVSAITALGSDIDGDVEDVGKITSRLRAQHGQRILGNDPVVRTGIASLDSRLSMKNGGLYLFVAEPSMGKTAFVRRIIYNVAKAIEYPEEECVMVFSMDDTPDEFIHMMACSVANVDSTRLDQNTQDQEEDDAYLLALDEIESLPIKVSGMQTMSPDVDTLFYEASMVNAQKSIKLCVIDYMSQLSVKTERGSSETRIYQRIAQGCKSMGRILNFPTILLHHLNKSVVSSDDKVPRPDDIPYSGFRESTAILGIMRPDQYKKNSESVEIDEPWEKDVVVLNLMKNKFGTLHKFVMGWYGPYTGFYDFAEPQERADYIHLTGNRPAVSLFDIRFGNN